MATLTVVLNTQYRSKAGVHEDKEVFPIYIRVHHLKERRLHPVGYRVGIHNWDDQEERVKGKHPEKTDINQAIEDLLTVARTYILECKLKKIPFDIDRVFVKEKVQTTFTQFLEQQYKSYIQEGQVNTELKVGTLVKQLRRWKDGEVHFTDLQGDGLKKLDEYLKKKGNSPNTRWAKFDLLKMFYSRAVKDAGAPLPNPFFDYKIKKTPVNKVKLSFEEFERFRLVEVTAQELVARDMFLLSYYCRGIRFENVLKMKKSAVSGDRLYFVAVKGGKVGSVKISEPLREILDRYLSTKGAYLFPVLQEDTKDNKRFLTIKNNRNLHINDALRSVAAKAGIQKEFTFHSSRHTFSMHLKRSGAPISFIKDSLLHHSERQTQVYLEELDDEHLDEGLDKYLYKK